MSYFYMLRKKNLGVDNLMGLKGLNSSYLVSFTAYGGNIPIYTFLIHLIVICLEIFPFKQLIVQQT